MEELAIPKPDPTPHRTAADKIYHRLIMATDAYLRLFNLVVPNTTINEEKGWDMLEGNALTAGYEIQFVLNCELVKDEDGKSVIKCEKVTAFLEGTRYIREELAKLKDAAIAAECLEPCYPNCCAERFEPGYESPTCHVCVELVDTTLIYA